MRGKGTVGKKRLEMRQRTGAAVGSFRGDGKNGKQSASLQAWQDGEGHCSLLHCMRKQEQKMGTTLDPW